MLPQPLYAAESANPAYCLRYCWTGFPSTMFTLPSEAVLRKIKPLWEADGLRLLEHRWSEEKIQLTFSASTEVSPTFVAHRAKGRLQYALRTAGSPQRFSRKVSVRSLGNNTSQTVEEYIRNQVASERFADPSFEATLCDLIYHDPGVDLAKPTASAHGRYWYNLHLVLVVAKRHRIQNTSFLEIIRDGCLRIAAVRGHRISTMSVLPDHLHLALRCNIVRSPSEVANCFQNNLAFLAGQSPIWEPNYYVGTFGEYTMNAVR